MVIRAKWLVVAVGLSLHAGVALSSTELLSVDVLITRMGKPAAPAVGKQSEGSKLLQDIAAYRAQSATLPADRAAKEWLVFWDRALSLDAAKLISDYAAFDPEISSAAGVRSVIAAVPPPAAWRALRDQVAARPKKASDDNALALGFIAALLSQDKGAVQQSLAALEKASRAASPEERETKGAAVERARALVYQLYGTREQITEAFRASVDAQARHSYMPVIVVPDLVGLVGAAKAETLIRDALKKSVSLSVPEGEATRALARKIALAEIASLRKPQWQLVDTIGAWQLYEALQKRFDPVAVADKSPVEESAEAALRFDYTRSNADIYYMIDMIIAGRQDAAERAMKRAASSGFGLSIPKPAIAALVKAGKNEALYNFLSKALERQPQLRAWNALVERSGFLGRSKETVALFDRLLKRPDLAPYLRAELSAKRLDALLAGDQVDEAVAGFAALLVSPPARDEKTLSERTNAAIRLAAIGRVLKRPELSETGLKFAKQAVALPASRQGRRTDSASIELQAELRRHGRVAEAQVIALAAITEESADARMAAFEGVMADPAKRSALVELAGIYDAAGRHTDVLRLFAEATQWGEADLQAIIDAKDSLGTPLGMMAARALKAKGDTAAANAIVRAQLDVLPGHDPAYQMLVELNGANAPAMLDKLYALDQFEERPLIWKAIALNAGRQYAEAEKAARLAIQIDPSDGEQGINDRMRVYAALADSLEGQGDKKSAQIYRGAVSAIRKSEQADELHKLGLYQRAFAGYRLALDDFSDAYCIQSRMAVQLGKLGLHEEAMKHYRRAYELMPDSFGRVESHCFGCESVFADGAAQGVADKVFADVIKRQPNKPQASYMLGYLRKEQGRYDEAVKLFRQAVVLDGEYLNAWKQLQELSEKTYIDAADRDVTRLRLLELDPRQRHVKYRLAEVADLMKLWNTVDRVAAKKDAVSKIDRLYPLAASQKAQEEALAKMPAEMRTQMESYKGLEAQMSSAVKSVPRPGVVLAQHALVGAALQFMGERSRFEFD